MTRPYWAPRVVASDSPSVAAINWNRAGKVWPPVHETQLASDGAEVFAVPAAEAPRFAEDAHAAGEVAAAQVAQVELAGEMVEA